MLKLPLETPNTDQNENANIGFIETQRVLQGCKRPLAPA